jgi:hypothetical protein
MVMCQPVDSTLEPFQGLSVLGGFFMQGLQGDSAFELGVDLPEILYHPR